MRSTKGPGSHFLGCARTQGNFETAFYRSTIADNNSFEQLEAEGRHPARQQALQDAGHEAPALDPAIDEALQEFMAKKKAAVPDSNV
ncbi:MAG TPA: trimethylamine methyltransferase family protein [Dongiaceae bacterium]|jgi:trimethylamine--corrinoid protein Co-methyltransferase|nr:trimethylamine methyltransferase family protein [Dongiaceae bacterium]